MSIVLEVGTKNYADDLLSIKKSLSHMESLLGCYSGYTVSEPSTKFGWTFFKLSFKPELQAGIEEKFSGMIEKYRWSDQTQKFVKFMTDYFLSRGCDVKIKLSD
ncbi:hypothetical protein C6990_09955 [Nitrosopumilus sp. b3]|uniref:hypothetical protein n=1 Tax=Nitrosopumilus sp. b3 TaxID=2109909 RepID=UPI0015F64B28|nr:hypothetical protein [Nitrosopumilus sp. b3]KAF6246198.1 hypothetical protein C6990_09955 [Nitrosopumilus sp. b3]